MFVLIGSKALKREKRRSYNFITSCFFSGPVRGIDFHCNQPLFVSGGDDYKIKVRPALNPVPLSLHNVGGTFVTVVNCKSICVALRYYPNV